MALDLSNLTVLIADDSRSMRSLIRDILKSLGVKYIHEVASGAAAFDLLLCTQIDIIIVDLHMQPVNGVELLQWLRLSPKSPNPYIPVIMVTGDSTRAMAQIARDVGISAFIAKPMTTRNLVAKLMFVLKDNRKFIRAKTYAGPDRRFRVNNGLPKAGRRSSDAKKRIKV